MTDKFQTDIMQALSQIQRLADGAHVKLALSTRDWLREHRTEVDKVREHLKENGLRMQQSLAQSLVHQFPDRYGFSSSELERAIRETFDFQRRMKEILGGVDFQEVRRRIEELPARTREALLTLGERGWYLDPSHHQFFEIAQHVAAGDVAEAEEALIGYYRERLDEIEAEIAERYPKRAAIVRAAAAAHRRGEYVLSVPVFLAQADGLCFDRFEGASYFMKKDGRPATASYLDDVSGDTLRAALLSPLTTSLPISASSKTRRETSFEGLNRHAVMHGESVDYGTEANSLRALSLLQYVAAVQVDETGEDDAPAGNSS